MKSSLPRGICHVCGRDVALRNHGLIREHALNPQLSVKERADAKEPGRYVCRGSGLEVWQ